jgi:hypothetical protein
MNSDSYFRISAKTATHPVCQDYAQAGEYKGGRYAIVADGCSSAPDTDFGSRLLTKCLVKQLSFTNMLPQAFPSTIYVADSCRRSIELPPESLHATLLCVVEEPWAFWAGVWGDGFVVARRRQDKSLLVIKHEFTSNAPYYLSYAIQPDNRQKYIEKFATSRDEFVIHKSSILNGDCVPFEVINQPVQSAMVLTQHVFEKMDYDLVAVISDGLGSFFKTVDEGNSRTDVPVDVEFVLEELFKFKGMAGSFVLRRSIKAFEKFEELGWKNADDFSIGVVCDG